jgi:hypothetical protein
MGFESSDERRRVMKLGVKIMLGVMGVGFLVVVVYVATVVGTISNH